MSNRMSNAAIDKAEKAIDALKEFRDSIPFYLVCLAINDMIEQIKEIKKVTINNGGK